MFGVVPNSHPHECNTATTPLSLLPLGWVLSGPLLDREFPCGPDMPDDRHLFVVVEQHSEHSRREGRFFRQMEAKGQLMRLPVDWKTHDLSPSFKHLAALVAENLTGWDGTLFLVPPRLHTYQRTTSLYNNRFLQRSAVRVEVHDVSNAEPSDWDEIARKIRKLLPCR